MGPPPRTIRFISAEDGQTYYGAPVQEGDLGLLYHANRPITAHILTSSPLHSTCEVSSTIKTVKRLLAPLDRHEIGTIRGMGMQYKAAGVTVVKPENPWLFFKPLTTLAGPGDDIVIPMSAIGKHNDYEVELCVVMGKDAKDVKVGDALSYVLGYCVVNDVTSRKLQSGISKSYDTWCPIGPVLVAASEVPNPDNLRIRTTVNGVVEQEETTANMVLSVAELISKLSQGVTVERGSLILTGSPTPLNRATAVDPWLRDGDEVRVEVEGLGTLVNHVVEVKPSTKL